MQAMLLSATTLTSVSASMPFLHADQLDIVKNNANQVDKQVQRAALRFLQEDSGPCDVDQETQMQVMQSEDCKNLENTMRALGSGSSSSGEQSMDDLVNMINTICAPSNLKCLGTIQKEMTIRWSSADCQALQNSLADEFAACKASAPPLCGSSPTCSQEDGQCVDERQVGSDRSSKIFESMCARKDAETTCFEAVFRPIFEAMESAGDSGTGAISLDDSCGTLAADADEATSNLYGCCVLEGYGCCLKTIEASFSSDIDTGDKADYATACPALEDVKPCPNPFKDTTYLKFDLEVACLDSTSNGEDLVLLKEGLTDAWELDSGSIELKKGDTSKVNVMVTVPEDLSADSVKTKIQNSNVSTTALAAHKGAACDVADTHALQVTQQVVQAPSSSAALAAIWMPLGILALL
jgi:hypothetical protein